MSAFEQAEVHEDGKEVHVGRVKLEVDAGGTDVVAGGHDPDHAQGEAHRVEQVIVKGYPCVSNLSLLSILKFEELLHPDHFDEKKTKDWVGYVAQEMVPHDERTSRLQALKIVETTVLITVSPKTKCDVSGTICSLKSNDRNEWKLSHQN